MLILVRFSERSLDTQTESSENYGNVQRQENTQLFSSYLTVWYSVFSGTEWLEEREVLCCHAMK